MLGENSGWWELHVQRLYLRREHDSLQDLPRVSTERGRWTGKRCWLRSAFRSL